MKPERNISPPVEADGIPDFVPAASEGSDAAPRPLAEPFEGLTHAEMLALKLEGPRCLIDDLVEAGTVGTIAGVPETYKSFLAQAIAVGVARGDGFILGRAVLAQGPVSYFWSDDSTGNQADRVRALEQATSNPPLLPLKWYPNSGLRLPGDIDRLRATIERDAAILAVLDSFYNLASGVSLKEEDAAIIFAALKAEVCDRTGCTVLTVDHAPWPNDQNRGQQRAYGSVFKGAAIRFGIYPEKEGSKLYVAAHGNNIRGFKRTPAYWDEEALELRLVDVDTDSDAKLEKRIEDVREWLVEHPGSHSTTAVRRGVGGRETITDEALEALKARAEVSDHGRNFGPWLGRRGEARYWIAASHAGSAGVGRSAQPSGPISADVDAGRSERDTSAQRPAPFRGAEVCRAEVDSGDGGHDAV